MGYFKFLLLWIKKTFSQSLGWADFLSGMFAADISAFNDFSSKGDVTMEDWEILLWAFAAVGLMRFLIAPYLLWKEEKEGAQENNRLITVGVEALPRKNILISPNSYAVHIGYLFSDLIDDWKREGIKSLPKVLSGSGSPPRAYTAWHSLEQLSTRVTLPLDIKPDLKKFLDYFQTTSSGLVEPLIVYHITTKIKTKPTLNKRKPEIESLAKSLEERLKNVTR